MALRQLTESEYFRLHAQYDITPAPEDSFGASGEHMILRGMLQKMGFSPKSYRGAELELAGQLLSQGYIREDESPD